MSAWTAGTFAFLLLACAPGEETAAPAECQAMCDRAVECLESDVDGCLADCRDVAEAAEGLQSGCGALYLEIQGCEAGLTCDAFQMNAPECEDAWIEFYSAGCTEV